MLDSSELREAVRIVLSIEERVNDIEKRLEKLEADWK